MAVNKFAPTEEELAYGKYVDQRDETKEVPWYKAYPAAIARSVIKGVIGVGEMMGPTGTPYERQEAAKEREKLFNEYLPLGEQKPPQTLWENVKAAVSPQAIERGGTTAVESLAFPGATLGRAGLALLGGGLAEGAKEAGASDIVQTGIEIATQLTPDLRKAIPSRLATKTGLAEKELLKEGRRLGLKEEELALLMDKKGFDRTMLEKVAYKGSRIQERIDNTRKSIGRVWENLRGSPEAQKTLTGQQSSQLINGLSSKLSELPAEQRTRILQDYNDLLGSQMRGEDVIDFWQKLNYYINKGEGKLGILKEDLQSALMQISPELGKDFKITNELYGNFARLSEKMTPTMVDNILSAGEAGAALTAIVTGNYPILAKVVGVAAARQLAAEMITNPRFVNLSSRFVNSMERGLPVVAKKVYEQMLIEVGKTNAEAAMKMSNFDIDELFEALEKERKKQNQ